MTKHLKHTLQDSFEYDGSWWLPDSPEDKVPGKLSFDPVEGTYLNLLGSFKKFPYLSNEIHECEVINGITSNGVRCTLIDNFETSRQLNMPGLSTERFVSNLLILGECLEVSEELQFSSSRVSFDHLEEWMTPKVFDFDFIEENNRITGYILKLHAQLFFEEFIETGNFEISLLNNISSPRRDPRIMSLKNEAFFKITPVSPLNFEEHIKLVNGISRLTALLIGSNTWPRKIHLIKEKANDTEGESRSTVVSVFYRLNTDHKPKTIFRHNMLVDFSTFVANLSSIVNRWFNAKLGIQSARDLFFLASYNDNINLENVFLSLVHALESYHRAMYNGKYVGQDEYEQYRKKIKQGFPEDLPSDLRNTLKDRLKYGNEFSLRKRLLQLFNDVDAKLAALVIDSPDPFVGKVVDTRNYYVHFDETLKSKAMDLDEMFDAQRRLALFTRILLLRDLGFEDEDIYRMLRDRKELLPLN